MGGALSKWPFKIVCNTGLTHDTLYWDKVFQVWVLQVLSSKTSETLSNTRLTHDTLYWDRVFRVWVLRVLSSKTSETLPRPAFDTSFEFIYPNQAYRVLVNATWLLTFKSIFTTSSRLPINHILSPHGSFVQRQWAKQKAPHMNDFAHDNLHTNLCLNMHDHTLFSWMYHSTTIVSS